MYHFCVTIIKVEQYLLKNDTVVKEPQILVSNP